MVVQHRTCRASALHLKTHFPDDAQQRNHNITLQPFRSFFTYLCIWLPLQVRLHHLHHTSTQPIPILHVQ
jgi:hypothetical protein